ncbi:MAG TPA: AAA family ATPase, partial [Streptosporangiaceae bacterium]|jgi:SpoVK/Ycf46/Vps4 family AAA+-type ATPase|nr:AAA family ATPase [Streptosporangiaceae bacterium]
MRPNDGSGQAMQMARERIDLLRQKVRAIPAPIKVVLVTAVLVLVVMTPFLWGRVAYLIVVVPLLYGPVAVVRGSRSVLASVGAGLWGLAVISIAAAKFERNSLDVVPLLLLPVVVVLLAHTRPLARAFVPCRTVALVLAWSLPPALLAWWLDRSQPAITYLIAWGLAVIVLGWRLGKAWQVARADTRQRARAGMTAPYGTASPGPGGRMADLGRGARAAEGAREQAAAVLSRDRPPTGQDLPSITVEQAMAELDAMIGLGPVKEQIRQLAASVEAAKRRRDAGYHTDKPLQHFVFLGPPGTGKTSVARIIAKIYYAFELLPSPNVVEAQRADLVGEFLGNTAIKTNELINSAIGGVLFIDEAYSLVNEGDGQGDRFGNEAVQALLKRAEDDRDDLVVILAGYQRQMENFLASNPGLNSRFAMRIKFPGFSPAELRTMALAALAQRGESLDGEAARGLTRMMDDVGRRQVGDELGNGRFVRNLLEKARQARDVRVMAGSPEPPASELMTLRAEDLERAFAELTSRFRGYVEVPTLENAMAELDELVGLEPVKRQVHEIVAQLQVARLRDRQGIASQPPARHFVFTGPPGTGKTTVARILARIFAALGLLVRPEVVEAHRPDLVGEHLGSTAIKTSKLIDSALGGVLFIDEAYALYNEGYSGGDAYGSEAVATLLKRAEDDRDRLVIVLAGYPQDMDRFLRTNPGLASRFSVRISFPGFTPGELAQIMSVLSEQAGDSFDPDALPVLDRIFRAAQDQERIDELGNGRFARSLFERACAARDLRVADLGEAASAADLTTVTAADIAAAAAGLTGGRDLAS